MEQLTKLTTFNSFANMLEALPNDEACRKY